MRRHLKILGESVIPDEIDRIKSYMAKWIGILIEIFFLIFKFFQKMFAPKIQGGMNISSKKDVHIKKAIVKNSVINVKAMGDVKIENLVIIKDSQELSGK